MNKISFSIKDKQTLIIFNVVLLIAAALISAVFLSNIKANLIEKDKQDELKSTRVYADSFEYAFKDQLAYLRLAASKLSEKDLESVESIREAMTELGLIGNFSTIRYAIKGVAYGKIEQEDRFVTGQQSYEQSLLGNETFSEELMNVKDASSAIILSVPVYDKENKVKAALLGYIYLDGFSDIINKMNPSDERIMIIDGAMNIIGKSNAEKLNRVKYQFDYYLRQFLFEGDFGSKAVVDLLKTREEGFYSIEYGDEDIWMILEPIEVHNWYMVRFVPLDDIRVQEAKITKRLSGFCFVFWLLLAFLLLVTDRGMMEVIRLNELYAKYSLLDNESKTITFSYNPDSRAVELDGAVEQAFGKEIAERKTINLVSLLDKLHETDQGLSKDMAKAVSEGENKYGTEIRIMKSGGKYDWYKLNAVILRDSSGKTRKIVGSLKNSEDQIAKEHVLRSKAEKDLLTGLLNKVTMENSIRDSIMEKPYRTLAFYIIDMDNFKAVNDNLGHAVGDKVLVDVANKLTLLFNEYDFIGRLGGDEFAVMLVIPENMSNYSNRLIELKAKSICENLRETYSDEDTNITVSASVGVAVYQRDGKTFEELYKNADQALYYSKNQGKNRYTFFSSLGNGQKE